MRDFTSNVDDDDLIASRDNRNSTINRPDIDPGMEDDDDDWGNIGGSDDTEGWSSNFGRDSMSGSPFSDMDSGMDSAMGGMMGGPMGGMMGGPMGGLNRGGFSQQYGSPMNNQMQQNQMKNPEDKVFDTLAAGAKGSINFIKEMIESFPTFDVVKRIKFGKLVLISSFSFLLLSLLSLLFKFPLTGDLGIAGFLGLAVGVLVYLPSYGDFVEKEKAGYFNENNENLNENIAFDNDFTDNDFSDDEELFNKNNDFDMPDEDVDVNVDLEDEDEEKPLFSESKTFNYDVNIDEPEVDVNEVIENLSDNQGFVTRQYLYESLVPLMESQKSNFADTVVLDEDSREFLAFCNIVEKAGTIVGGEKVSNYPQVLKVEDKLFYTRLTLTRPNWLVKTKLKSFIEEIVNMCAFDKEKDEIDPNVTGSGSLIGDEIILKIMKGETAVITVKDAFSKVKDLVLNTKYESPLILGVDKEGNPVFLDFKNVPGMLVSGAPRTGKSWCVKAIVGQLMMFKKPSQLHIYCIDPKDKTSDFFTLETPHVRQFISEDDDIMKLLDYICNEEANRRADMLYKIGGYKNVNDMRKDHPEIDMPDILVIIDEIITISQRMDKETRTEFFSYLRQFVSRLPGYGIRLLMIPHLVKNSVVDKSVTDMLPNRIIVKGSPKDIENILDVKPSEFPYKLGHVGDMAVKMNTPEATFVHSIVISGTNQGYDKFFDILTNFWLKLEPNSFKGSKLEYDIKNGYQNINHYPILENSDLFDISYLTMDENESNDSNVELDLSSNNIDNNIENQKVRPKRPKISQSSTKSNIVKQTVTEEYLTDSECSELLKDVNDDNPKKSINRHRIKSDEDLL